VNRNEAHHGLAPGRGSRPCAARRLLRRPPRGPAAPIPWLWHGYLAPGNLTLLTSQWKTGQTTLVAALLARLAAAGWVFKHKADLTPDGVITIRGREVIEGRDGEQRHRRTVEEFALDTRSGVWRRLTNRNWLQFAIRQADHQLFVLERSPGRERLFPTGIEHTPERVTSGTRPGSASSRCRCWSPRA